MAPPEARVCPHCGSPDLEAFADGSGACRSCGRAFRGSVSVGLAPVGETAEESAKVGRVRKKERLGLLGILCGLMGYLDLPAQFLIGSVTRGRDALVYVAEVLNTPRGALVCGGLSFLSLAATYALWAGSWVWRGFTEKALHLLLAGVLCTASAAIAGPGIEGAVGISGGILALLGGVLVWRGKSDTADPATGAPSSPPEA